MSWSQPADRCPSHANKIQIRSIKLRIQPSETFQRYKLDASLALQDVSPKHQPCAKHTMQRAHAATTRASTIPAVSMNVHNFSSTPIEETIPTSRPYKSNTSSRWAGIRAIPGTTTIATRQYSRLKQATGLCFHADRVSNGWRWLTTSIAAACRQKPDWRLVERALRRSVLR